MMPSNFLIYSLNAAVASVVACAIAVVLSRRQAWSLPARHAILVAALVASLLAPLVVPLLRLPSLWAIRVSEAAHQQPTTIESTKSESSSEQVFAPEWPVASSVPRAEPGPDRPSIARPDVVPPASTAPEQAPSAPGRGQSPVSASNRARIIGTAFCGVWLVGILLGVARSLVCLARLRRWTRTITVADSPELDSAARSAADALGLRNEIVIYRSSLLPAPITCGLFRPRIVVPAGIESDLSSEQLRAVIKHEVAHLARRDLWIGLLQQTAQVIYWWNPLVPLANRQLADLREQICDDIAVRELPEPGAYAATLLKIAEQCSPCTPVPATLGFGSSPAGQLESRIRRIVSSPRATCIRLSRRAVVGVLAVAVGMTATILLAQVQIKSNALEQPGDKTKSVPAEVPAKEDDKQAKNEPQDPTLHDLIQQMAAYERMYLPYDIKVMETFRFPDDLTPQEKARNLRADGRKHQRLMEYAQLAKQIWRSKETDLVDDEIEQGPYDRFSDGERIVQRGPSSVTINGVTATEYYINGRKRHIEHYLSAASLLGVFCLSQYGAGELFSEAFKDDKEAVELAWDNGDAKLTFVFGKPDWNTKYVLWLSRAHAWHPIRWQRYWDAKDKFWFDEWEVTKFVPHGRMWRVAEGTHRYRELGKGRQVADPKIKYSMDFKVLSEKYGSDVDEKQFHIEIPPGAKVREEDKPEAEPPPPTKTREITVTVIDVAGKPIPQASVRLPASPLRNHDLMTTDNQGVSQSAKAPADDVLVKITAAGFRPVTWIMGEGSNELRAIMVPQTNGVVVDRGHPVADVWITNGSLQVRADGYTYVPARDWDGRDDDWSAADGRFELKSELTLRRADVQVPLIAIDQGRERMAIRFVPSGELGKQQELALQSVCHVHGHCLLQEMKESVEVGIGLETSAGQSIGWLSTRRELTPEGLRVDFEVRLPPGAYLLKTPQSSHHSGFTIPLAIPADKEELNLGTKTVPVAGAALLRGKPAPELDVEWRPGQELSWEKLRGKVVVLDFWGTWCGPCVAGMPTLMEIHDQFKGKPVEWLSVHTPNLKTLGDFDLAVAKCEERDWNKKKLPFTAVIDHPVVGHEYSGKTSERYGVAEWPTLIVVDQQGKVVGPVNKKKLAETVAQLLDKKDAK